MIIVTVWDLITGMFIVVGAATLLGLVIANRRAAQRQGDGGR